jgi:hypothetical protein
MPNTLGKRGFSHKEVERVRFPCLVLTTLVTENKTSHTSVNHLIFDQVAGLRLVP